MKFKDIKTLTELKVFAKKVNGRLEYLSDDIVSLIRKDKNNEIIIDSFEFKT